MFVTNSDIERVGFGPGIRLDRLGKGLMYGPAGQNRHDTVAGAAHDNNVCVIP